MRKEATAKVLSLCEALSTTCGDIIDSLRRKHADAKTSESPSLALSYAEDIRNMERVAETIHSITDDARANVLQRSHVLLLEFCIEHAREKLRKVPHRIKDQNIFREEIIQHLEKLYCYLDNFTKKKDAPT
jgi:hypothetical protein